MKRGEVLDPPWQRDTACGAPTQDRVRRRLNRHRTEVVTAVQCNPPDAKSTGTLDEDNTAAAWAFSLTKHCCQNDALWSLSTEVSFRLECSETNHLTTRSNFNKCNHCHPRLTPSNLSDRETSVGSK